MRVLGIETSCDETGAGVYDNDRGLLAHALHSQVALHDQYGGVVPELASRDHVRRLLPLVRTVLHRSGMAERELDAVAFTQGPGLAGALLVGATFANGLAFGLGIPAIGVHHLEGHLLSPLLQNDPPRFPFVSLLVSGGHTQLMRVSGLGGYELLGETLDDAAGEAFDKTAKLLGLGYPGGPALAALAERGERGRFALPRPMLARMEKSGDLDFSFSGLKTAVVTLLRKERAEEPVRADVAAAFQEAIVDVLVEKSRAAIERTGLDRLVVAGGVGANARLRARLDAAASRDGFAVYYPPVELCTDNGAMIALAGAMRLQASPSRNQGYSFAVRPRWDLAGVGPAVEDR